MVVERRFELGEQRLAKACIANHDQRFELVAAAGVFRLERGDVSPLDGDVDSSLRLGS